MRKLNSVTQLGRTQAHRNALMVNMATSLFKHERIISTKTKIKVLQRYAERLITRAKKIASSAKPENALHHKRVVFKKIKDGNITAKLFDDIAKRFADRNGGYTRIINLPPRRTDASPMAMIELVAYVEPKKKEKSSDKKENNKKEK